MTHDGIVAIISAILSGVGYLAIRLAKAYVIYLQGKNGDSQGDSE